MQLQEIFEQLSGGEFSQLSIGGAGAGVIDNTNYAKVTSHINLGLMALHRRFNLKEGRLVLSMQPEQTLYHLKSANSVTGAEIGVTPFIIDSLEDPFLDDILKIEKVIDAEGWEIGLNDPSDSLSVSTPSALKLRVPEELETQDLTVVYRAAHPKLVVDSETIPSEVEVVLPDSHLDALLYYVASRVNNPIGMTNEFHAGNSYAAKYEMVCQELEGHGLEVDQGSQTNERAARGGWV